MYNVPVRETVVTQITDENNNVIIREVSDWKKLKVFVPPDGRFATSAVENVNTKEKKDGKEL